MIIHGYVYIIFNPTTDNNSNNENKNSVNDNTDNMYNYRFLSPRNKFIGRWLNVCKQLRPPVRRDIPSWCGPSSLVPGEDLGGLLGAVMTKGTIQGMIQRILWNDMEWEKI